LFVSGVSYGAIVASRSTKAEVGAVTGVQRFGSSLNLHVHFHTLVVDGVHTEEPDGTLRFVPAPPPTRTELLELLTRIEKRVMKWLVRAPSSTTHGRSVAPRRNENALACPSRFPPECPRTMPPLSVVTWNVLHRIHAENWRELPALLETAEVGRTRAIAERIHGGNWDIACMQEVSGDLLAVLRETAPSERTVWALASPRVPRLKDRMAVSPLATPTEHLVTVVAGPARVLRASSFPSDPGKGFLSVALGDGLVVINAHITWGEKSAAQLQEIAAHVREQTGPVVLVGDFNADAATVGDALGPGYAFAALPASSLATRPRHDGRSKSQNIDHLIVWQATAADAQALDAGGLSDHNLVVARILA
jgi:endonuclease/exonuclease/phosphatase family metal-dependent hydrolase